MKNIQIIVAGEASTGKSTIAMLIEETLKKQGFNVQFEMKNEVLDYGTENNFRNVVGTTINERIESLKPNLNITLKQMQLKREPKINENSK